MSDNKQELVTGLFAYMPSVDFVKCRLAIKRKDLGNWLRGKEDDWINVDVKQSENVDEKGNNKWYCAVNTFKPKNDSKPKQEEKDIPF